MKAMSQVTRIKYQGVVVLIWCIIDKKARAVGEKNDDDRCYEDLQRELGSWMLITCFQPINPPINQLVP